MPKYLQHCIKEEHIIKSSLIMKSRESRRGCSCRCGQLLHHSFSIFSMVNTRFVTQAENDYFIDIHFKSHISYFDCYKGEPLLARLDLSQKWLYLKIYLYAKILKHQVALAASLLQLVNIFTNVIIIRVNRDRRFLDQSVLSIHNKWHNQITKRTRTHICQSRDQVIYSRHL